MAGIHAMPDAAEMIQFHPDRDGLPLLLENPAVRSIVATVPESPIAFRAECSCPKPARFCFLNFAPEPLHWCLAGQIPKGLIACGSMPPPTFIVHEAPTEGIKDLLATVDSTRGFGRLGTRHRKIAPFGVWGRRSYNCSPPYFTTKERWEMRNDVGFGCV